MSDLDFKRKLEEKADQKLAEAGLAKKLLSVNTDVRDRQKKLEEEAKKQYDAYVTAKTANQISDFIRAQEDRWRETSEEQEALNVIHREYLAKTDWAVLRFLETGKEVPQEIKEKRNLARQAIEHGDYVYSEAQRLRDAHYPSLEDRYEAYRQGGYNLIELRKKMAEVNARFPKPRGER